MKANEAFGMDDTPRVRSRLRRRPKPRLEELLLFNQLGAKNEPVKEPQKEQLWVGEKPENIGTEAKRRECFKEGGQ